MNKHLFLVALLPALALAQGVPLKDGTTSNLATVDTGGRLTVKLADQFGSQAWFTDDGRIDVGRDTPIFEDRFTGSAVSSMNKWVQSLSTMTATQASGAVTLNAGGSVATSVYANFTTLAKFRGYADGDLYFHARMKPLNLAIANTQGELGFGNATTNTTPTDGAFFRWTTSGTLQAVLNRGGVETTSNFATQPAMGVYSNFSIKVNSESATFAWNTPSTNSTFTIVTITLDPLAPSAFVEAPGVLMRVQNLASAPAFAPSMAVGMVEVMNKVHDLGRPVGLHSAVAGQSAAYTPTTGVQSTNFTNSTAPASAALSNVTPSYTTLGGKWQLAAVAGAVTDFPLFGYTVPTSFRLVVTGVSISTCNTVVAVATTPTLFEWGVGVQASAGSLATADATGAAPTTAPRRLALGDQSLAVGTAAGVCTTDLVRDFSAAPLVIDSGRVFTVILQMPVGTATATEIFRGTVTVAGYFEMQ